MPDEHEEIPGQHRTRDEEADDRSPGRFGPGEEPAGSGRGSNSDGTNMLDDAAAPADPSRG